ncbi:hypothetical protein [Spirobacillus cienkowskii]|uniref:hypothetical protein n=1 Tax=Spirobacillus cienkowskii TaxID=495820 RepID=UPI0030CB586F
MIFKEDKIFYLNWVYLKNSNKIFIIILISAACHAICFFLFIYFFGVVNLNNKSTMTSKNKDPVHIQLQPSRSLANSGQLNKKSAPKDTHIPQNRTGGVLTDLNPNSQSSVLIPESLFSPSQKPERDPLLLDQHPQKTTNKKIVSIPKSSQKKEVHGIEDFLPSSSPSYIDKLRKESLKHPQIVGDSGDVPIVGDDLAPRMTPKISNRYSVKDLRLFQFSLEFKERFSGIWNAKERWLPPTTVLRPGDVVYYKLYIQGDGTLKKFENLSHKRAPLIDFTPVDKMIEEVITKVFPMNVPPHFTHNMFTEVVAIQVVGTNRTIQYSFQ